MIVVKFLALKICFTIPVKYVFLEGQVPEGLQGIQGHWVLQDHVEDLDHRARQAILEKLEVQEQLGPQVRLGT